MLDNHTTRPLDPLDALRADDPPFYPDGMVGARRGARRGIPTAAGVKARVW